LIKRHENVKVEIGRMTVTSSEEERKPEIGGGTSPIEMDGGERDDVRKVVHDGIARDGHAVITRRTR
jgi:hypothetical protein